MSARYRLVHFDADPFLGRRFPVGAVVANQGEVQFVQAPHLPDERCLGGADNLAHMQLILLALRETRSLDVRAPAPNVFLGDVVEIPASVHNPRLWAEEMLNGGRRPVRVHDEPPPGHKNASQRARLARSFYQQHQVANYVRERFRPGATVAGPFVDVTTLENVTQYVLGASSLLLVEPIVPQRAEFFDDVREVYTRFGAYQKDLQRAAERGDPWRVELLAVVFPGASAPRDRAMLELGRNARVVDVSHWEATAAFVHDVRRVGSSLAPDLFHALDDDEARPSRA